MMIKNFYPHKRPAYMPPAMYHGNVLNNTSKGQQQQQKTINTTHPPDSLMAQAAAKGIDVMEWSKRDRIVREHARECTFIPGEEVFPATVEDFLNFGPVRIVSVCQSYSKYGDVAWSEAHPKIVEVVVVADTNKRLFCPVGWLSSNCPDVENIEC